MERMKPSETIRALPGLSNEQLAGVLDIAKKMSLWCATHGHGFACMDYEAVISACRREINSRR